MGRMSVMTEFWEFLRHRKKFWLLPLVVILLLLGVVIVLTANSALAPFIYTVF
jgi:competence protein ComGC